MFIGLKRSKTYKAELQITFHESIWVLLCRRRKAADTQYKKHLYVSQLGISSGQMKSVDAQFIWGVPLLLDRRNIIDRRSSVGLTHMCFHNFNYKNDLKHDNENITIVNKIAEFIILYNHIITLYYWILL